MATSALDIVSLERMRNELRIPQQDTGHDEFLKQIIGSAVSIVTADLNVPLLDFETSMDIQGPSSIAYVRDDFAQSLTSLRTQDDSRIDGYFPLEIPASDYTIQSPSINSWIKGLIVVRYGFKDQLYQFTYIRGIPNHLIERYQQIVIVRARAIYTGVDMQSPTSSYSLMVKSLRNFQVNPYLDTSIRR